MIRQKESGEKIEVEELKCTIFDWWKFKNGRSKLPPRTDEYLIPQVDPFTELLGRSTADTRSV